MDKAIGMMRTKLIGAVYENYTKRREGQAVTQYEQGKIAAFSDALYILYINDGIASGPAFMLVRDCATNAAAAWSAANPPA